MPDKECIELAKLVGFRVEQYSTNLLQFHLRTPNGEALAVGPVDECWSHAPDFKAPHDGLAELSRLVWPVLTKADLWNEFKREIAIANSQEDDEGGFRNNDPDDWAFDLPGQVTAAITVLKEVEGAEQDIPHDLRGWVPK